MKVLEINQAAGLASRQDIQIQTACQKIAIELTGIGCNDAKIRLRFVSPGSGTRVLIDYMSLATLLEYAAADEGYFTASANAISGMFIVSERGALDLKDGYLSLDIEPITATVTSMKIYAVENPVLSDKYVSYNPVYVNGGITREINLKDARAILIPVAGAGQVSSINLEYPSRSVSFDAVELKHIARDLNDIVSVESSVGPASFGAKNWMRLETDHCNRMTVVPFDATAFYVYLIDERPV